MAMAFAIIVFARLPGNWPNTLLSSGTWLYVCSIIRAFSGDILWEDQVAVEVENPGKVRPATFIVNGVQTTSYAVCRIQFALKQAKPHPARGLRQTVANQSGRCHGGLGPSGPGNHWGGFTGWLGKLYEQGFIPEYAGVGVDRQRWRNRRFVAMCIVRSCTWTPGL